MGVYLYCVGGADQPDPDGVDGVDGAPVRALDLAGFRAWVSDHEAAPAASLDRVRSHNRVAEAAALDVTPLPLRFGQWFESRDRLESALRERRDELESGLRRVAGALELGVRLVDPSARAPEPDRSTGRAYLETLARRDRAAAEQVARGRAVAEQLRGWLGGLVREQRVRALGTGGGLVAVAHLVGRHDIGNYRPRIHEFEDRVPDLRLVISGPWPPYGFVDER